MSVLKNTPIVWDSRQEEESICIVLDAMDFRRHVSVRTPNRLMLRKTKFGNFNVAYHTFEQALEVTSEDEMFRFVYGKNFIRIDGDKAALKQWLMIHKLTA